MHILEEITVDATGRLLLTKVFEEMPKEVIVSFDTKTKKLFFHEAEGNRSSKIARKIDSKNRVCLPKWVLTELGKRYYVCTESIDEHFVLPSKFIFIC